MHALKPEASSTLAGRMLRAGYYPEISTLKNAQDICERSLEIVCLPFSVSLAPLAQLTSWRHNLPDRSIRIASSAHRTPLSVLSLLAEGLQQDQQLSSSMSDNAGVSRLGGEGAGGGTFACRRAAASS